MKITMFLAIPLFLIVSCSPSIGLDQCREVRVVDGDTIRCSNFNSSIRMIPSYTDPSIWFDAPEISHRAECPSEKVLGLESKSKLKSMLYRKKVYLKGLSPEYKQTDYFGRHLKEVLVGNSNMAHELTRLNLGKIYHKSRHPISWCENEKDISN